MIRSEFITRAMINMSRTEIDFYLYLLRFVDWDGNVRATVDQIATGCRTTVMYVRDLINKGLAKGFLQRDPYNQDLLQCTLASTSVDFDPYTDRYSKKFTFLYSEEFRKLSVNAKRILLMAAFRMSVSGSPYVVFNKKEIFIRSTLSVSYLLPLDETKFQMAIKDIRTSMGHILDIFLASDRLTKESQLHIKFHSSVLNSYFENHTELFLMQRTIALQGNSSVIEHAHCVEMLKTAKHLFRTIPDRRLARSIYTDALEKMSSFTRAVGDRSPGGASAYFSKIIHENIKTEMIKVAQQIEHIEELRGNFNLTLANRDYAWMKNIPALSINQPEIEERLRYYRSLIADLMRACEKWVSSRISTEEEDGIKTKNIEKKKEKILSFIKQDLESLIERKESLAIMNRRVTASYNVKLLIENYQNLLLSLRDRVLTQIS